ncbi:TPA: DNA topoisomerase IV subunit A [archaeon]|nr:DNA topoisomerase IV subunit A [Candidatus Undinarchaeales archaeon SRR5007147.bin71]
MAAKNKDKTFDEKIKKESLDSISGFGKKIVASVEDKNPPVFEIPLRSKTNISFDEKQKILVLGDKTSSRRFLNVAHARKFMQSALIASACKEYIEHDRTVGKRELYYNLKHSLPNSKENTFEDDIESGTVLNDLEASMGVLRERLHIEAKARGSIYGDITLSQAGDTFDCSKLGRGGWAIPGYTEDVDIINYKADFILAIENDAMMSRLIQEKVYKNLNCLLVTGEGMFPRGVRRFIKLLNEKLKLPVIAFVDGDPYGFYIYSVLKYGSIELAHLSERYAVPNTRYVGMTMDDIETYELQNVTEQLKEVDKKRIKEELGYMWFKNNPAWVRQLEKMLEMGVRIEQQALANKSLDFVAKKYLPEKIKEENFLD